MFSILSPIYLAQIMNLVGLYNTSTFGPLQSSRRTHLVTPIGYYYKFIVAARPLSNCPFILPFLLCTMVLMQPNKHEVLSLKLFLDAIFKIL